MNNNNKLHCFHDKDIEVTYGIAVHALREYRLWRDNAYIGGHLGKVRPTYVAILKGRVRDAIDAYRLMRAQSSMAEQQKAA